MPNKTVIITGYTCNNNCIFCYDIEKRKKYLDLNTQEIKNRLDKAKKLGSDYVDFIGGEFTIRKDAIEIVRYARSIGFLHIAITTNGRLLSYERIFDDFVEAGANSIIFSIHGHNADLHDTLTGTPGSFRQLKKAISNAHNIHMKIFTNTTICSKNYEHLEEIANFLVSLKVDNSEFIYIDPTTGGANLDFSLVPKIKDTSVYVKKLLDIGRKNNIRHWKVRYLPLCYLEGYEEFVSENTEWFDNEVHMGPEFTNTDVQGSRRIVSRIKVDKCANCRLNKKCEGIWKRYIEEYGDDDIKPVPDISDDDIKKKEIDISKIDKISLKTKCKRGCALIINDKDEILLMKRNKLEKEYYVIIGGRLEKGETIEECTIREAKEETELDIVLGDIEFNLEDEKCKYYYFSVRSFSGKEKISGEELKRTTKNNRYGLKWIRLKDLHKTNLLPIEIKDKLVDKYSNKSI